MSESQDDPLLGLLTDIAEGVATLSSRIDAIETRMAEQNDITNEALATIAEIATRTYYASKPSSALPDDIINANVMDAMIDRWSLEWVMRFPSSEFRMLKDLQSLSVAEIEAILRQRAVVTEDATNAQRLRHARIVAILNEEMDKRIKAQQKGAERDSPGRSR
jgi:hypothetical protein